MNLSDWNNPEPEPVIDPDTGLPEGWSKSDQEITTDGAGFIQINSRGTGIVIALGYVLDDAGDRAGINLSEPQLVIAGVSDAHMEYLKLRLPDMLRTMAENLDNSTTHEISSTVVDAAPEPGTNQQAEE